MLVHHELKAKHEQKCQPKEPRNSKVKHPGELLGLNLMGSPVAVRYALFTKLAQHYLLVRAGIDVMLACVSELEHVVGKGGVGNEFRTHWLSR